MKKYGENSKQRQRKKLDISGIECNNNYVKKYKTYVRVPAWIML